MHPGSNFQLKRPIRLHAKVPIFSVRYGEEADDVAVESVMFTAAALGGNEFPSERVRFGVRRQADL